MSNYIGYSITGGTLARWLQTKCVADSSVLGAETPGGGSLGAEPDCQQQQQQQNVGAAGANATIRSAALCAHNPDLGALM